MACKRSAVRFRAGTSNARQDPHHSMIRSATVARACQRPETLSFVATYNGVTLVGRKLAHAQSGLCWLWLDTIVKWPSLDFYGRREVRLFGMLRSGRRSNFLRVFS